MDLQLRFRGFSLPALLLLASSCADSSSAPVQAVPSILAGPSLVPNPDPAVPLSAILTLETNMPTSVELAFDDGVRQWTEVAVAELRTIHSRVPVLGMRQDRTVEIQVILRDGNGNATPTPEKLIFTPPPLPDNFPPVRTTISEPASMEPGNTLFNVYLLAPPRNTFLVMLDEEGELVWYYDGSKSPLTANDTFNFFPLPNGNLMLLSGRNLAIEMNLLGDVKQTWWASGVSSTGAPAGATLVDTQSFHHEIAALPEEEEADFVALSSELRILPNYPADVQDPTQTTPEARVVGDTIVEFKRDGTVVRELKLFDILDPYRVSYDSLNDFWNVYYTPDDTEDWTHANGVAFDPSDDTYIVSLRHQDAVVKIDRSGDLVWLLGDPARWNVPWSSALLTPMGTRPFEWSYHQHAPEITPKGTILLFDNGNNRAIPPTPALPFGASYSRAVEYRIDPSGNSVEQVWAYGGMFDPAHSFYSFFLGDANRLPNTGNVLVTDGGKQVSETNPLIYGRVVEVTHESPPREVFEVMVRDDSPVDPVRYAIYRSHRFPSVYAPPPSIYWDP